MQVIRCSATGQARAAKARVCRLLAVVLPLHARWDPFACEQLQLHSSAAGSTRRASSGRAHPRAVPVVLGDHLPKQLLHLKLAALRRRGGASRDEL